MFLGFRRLHESENKHGEFRLVVVQSTVLYMIIVLILQ